MKLVATLALLCGLAAGEKTPLTQDEMQNAYQISVDYISARLKAPSTAKFSTPESSAFSRGRKESVDVRLFVDAQNSFGAMLRKGWFCRVTPRTDGRYNVICFER